MKMKTLDRDGRKIRGYAIISKGDTPEKIGRGVWKIASQSGNGFYTIESKHSEKTIWKQLYTCSCPDWERNLQDCKHIHAIRFWLDIKEKIQNDEPMEKPDYKINVCPHCQSDKLIKRGKRKNSQIQKQRYSCKECGKRFI